VEVWAEREWMEVGVCVVVWMSRAAYVFVVGV
jgi:hypothetical protein